MNNTSIPRASWKKLKKKIKSSGLSAIQKLHDLQSDSYPQKGRTSAQIMYNIQLTPAEKLI